MVSNRNSLMCPLCDSADVRASRRFNFVQQILTFSLIRPFRCVECRYRFWRISRHAQGTNETKPISVGV
jgi:hypothetical protein